MKEELRLLLVEDVATDAELEVRELKRAGIRVAHRLVDTEQAFRAALSEFRPQIIISDFSMPHFDGMFALALSRELAPDVPFIFVSGTIGEEYAIRALKNGATDYVLKNNLVRLPATVERALQEANERAAQRKLELELNETRNRLDNIVNSLSDVVWSFSLNENRLLYVSPAVRTMYRQPATTFYANPLAWMDAIHPEDRGRVEEEWIASVAARRFDSTYRIVLADGEVLWINNRGNVITDDRDQPVRIDGLARDITKGKLDEEALRESGSRLDLALQASGLATWDWNIVTGEVRFSRHWWPILGYEPDEKPHHVEPWRQLVHPEDLPRLDSALARCFGGSVPLLEVEYRMVAKSGGWRWIRTVGQVTERDAAGRAVRQIGTHGDVTERRLQQERIARLSRIHAVLSGINSAIVRIRDRQRLLEEACRIAVEHGGFGIAWIGRFDPRTLDIVPVAAAGVEAHSFVAAGQNSANPASSPDYGVVGRAIHERSVICNNDLTVESRGGGSRRQEALRRGYHSLIALPLQVNGEVMGNLSLFAREPNFFDKEEIELLTDLADDISFGLENIARQERIEKLSRIRAVSSGINAAIARIHDRAALLREVCRIASEQGRFEAIWVGSVDEPKQEVAAVAWAGFSEPIARRVSWKTISGAQGTLAEAVRNRRTSMRNDIAAELSEGAMRTEALARGCGSAVCVPLVVDGSVIALIALFAAGKDFFDAEELALLGEMAADLGLALQSMAQREQVEFLSYYDALTGLPNRHLFVNRLGQQMRARGGERRMVSLVLLNLERFRNINETLGRQGGDELLRQVAQRLDAALGGRDSLAHLGADGFGVVVRGVREAADVAHIVEQQIFGCLRDPFTVYGKELRAVARAGIALYPVDGGDPDTLYKNAEAALNNAKSASERYLFYAPQMNARVADQLKLENDLRQALQREQFVLYYQPKFELAGGHLVGMEALIRWNHPERGFVSPGEFVPVLEATGMIQEVGCWVLARAAAQHAAWSGLGLGPPRIAVNVSLAQLRRRDFVEYVREALESVPQAAARVDIEITESMLMEDIDGSIDKLKRVQDLGLNVAIDDFGTGYSSLSYLARLPINSLKIDRSFIVQMPSSPEQMAIVSTVISLARALNLKVVAEGVETEEQANLLRLLRCDEVQGYFFGKPMPSDAIAGLLPPA